MAIMKELESKGVKLVRAKLYEGKGINYAVIFQDEKEFVDFVTMSGIKMVFHSDQTDLQIKGVATDREKLYVVIDGVPYIVTTVGE